MSIESVGENNLHLIRNIPFTPTAEAVLAAMKIRRVSPSLSRLAEELTERSREIANPKALCRVSYVDSRTDDTVIIDGRRFTSRVLRQNLEGIERVFPYVATCGAELASLLEDRADIMASYCLDTIMMLAVNAARRHMQSFIRETFSLGQMSRMAPGSLKDWPLDQQAPLFALFAGAHRLIGVELSERFLMMPIKTVSGIFFPTEVRFESCQLCPRENCFGRRSPYDPALAARYGV